MGPIGRFYVIRDRLSQETVGPWPPPHLCFVSPSYIWPELQRKREGYRHSAGKEADFENEFMCRAPKMLEKNADPERRYTCVVIITVKTHCYWILGPQSDVIGRW